MGHPQQRTKNKWMTLEQKCEIIVKFHQTTPPPSLSALVRWAHTTFSLPNAPSRSTIMYIPRNANDIKCKFKTSKTPKGHVLNLRCPELEARLEKFIEETERDHVHPSRGLILEQAKDILMSIQSAPALKLSDDWMTSFLKRHGLRSRPLHGEAASVNPADIVEGRMAMQDVTRHFALRDVWNMDETGLLYRAATTRGICKLGTAGLKKDKTRITLALAANADGSEKRDVFFIGRAKKPYCFKGKEGWQLGYYYRNNKKAWMTMTLYSEWVRVFDNDMRKEGRQILLLLDNASSHVLDDSGVLSNITVQKLLPNTTSHIQPMDAGIIAALKSGYRIKLYRLAMYRALRSRPEIKPTGKTVYYVDQLQAMKWVCEVWATVKKETIVNCFRKSGIVFAEKFATPPERRTNICIHDILS